VINWTGDVREPVPRWYFDLGRHISLTCFSNEDDPAQLEKEGIPSSYLQIGFDPDTFYPGPEKKGDDIVFFGNNYGSTFPLSQLRFELAVALHKRYGKQFKVFGTGWPPVMKADNLNGKEDAEATIYRSCAIAIGCSHFDLRRYSSDRVFRAMGSGALYLTKHWPDIELDFDDGKDLVVWADVEDMLKKTDYLLEHPDEARKIAMTGCKKVHELHSWQARMEDVKKLYDERCNNLPPVSPVHFIGSQVKVEQKKQSYSNPIQMVSQMSNGPMVRLVTPAGIPKPGFVVKPGRKVL
jgi:hypothetical protein